MALEQSKRKSFGQWFYFTMGDERYCMSAEESSCLESVYTVRRSEKWADDESEKKL